MAIEKRSRYTKAAIVAMGPSKVLGSHALGFLKEAISNKPTVEARMHGEIDRTADGGVDLAAEIKKHPDALWIRVKAIEADEENDNGDYFSRDEILKSYKTFEGCPVFTNHENQKVEHAKGKVVLAEWSDEDNSVYCTMFIDREANPSLCRAIEEGYVTDVSMGTQVDFSVCSYCKNKAHTADQYCVVPDTPILMSDFSIKEIKDVEVGDEVIDAFGRETKVTKVYEREIDEAIQAIQSRSIVSSLLCTGNHPLLVSRRGSPKFVHAHDVDDKETLFTPVYRGDDVNDRLFADFDFEKTEENKCMLARLVGYMAAEGGVFDDNRREDTEAGVSWTFHSDETDFIDDVENICLALFGKRPCRYDHTKYGKNSTELRLNDAKLARSFSKHVMGKKSTKKLSDAVCKMPISQVWEFIRGYVDGDGHADNAGQTILTSSSRDLSSQIYHMLLRAHCSGATNKYKNAGGPTSRDNACWVYRTSIGASQARHLGNCGCKIGKQASLEVYGGKLQNIFTEGNGFAKHSAYGIEEVAYKGPVFNLETESHSYVANNTAVHNCDHVKTMKGRSVEGKKIYEENYGLKFIEISVVTDGACKDCTIREVIDPDEYIGVESAAEHMMAAASNLRQIKTGLYKDGSQAEIEMLNAAMDNIEKVLRSMLDQREYIDLEFMNNLTEVFAELQHVTDELVDQGYGSLGAPQQQAEPIPAIPENEKEQAPTGPNAFSAGPTSTGVGTVTQPTAASSDVGSVKLSSKDGIRKRLKDLGAKAQKIYEEINMGDYHVSKAEKYQNTISKLATIWENPSVKNFTTEVSEGDYKIVVGKEEILGLKGGKKVACLKMAELDPDIKDALRNDRDKTASAILDALKSKFASLQKKAEAAPVDTQDQWEQTMEAQLRDQKPPLHYRENDTREVITERQMREDWHGYDHHKQGLEGPRHEVTEKQLQPGLSSGYEMYDYHKVQNEPRDEIQELQIRNESWQGNKTPGTSDREWADGVSDQKQQITEGQLDDWKKPDERHLPSHHITEKQLRDDQGDPLGRRVASITDENAKLVVQSGINAIRRTAIATGATPEEILDAINDFNASPENGIKAEKVAAFVDNNEARQTRHARLKRSAYYGSTKVASMNEVCSYLLGSLSDENLAPKAGLRALKVLASQEDAKDRFAAAIKEGFKEEPAKNASEDDLLRSAISDPTEAHEATSEPEDVKVLVSASEIEADASDKEAYAKAAFALGAKYASEQGVKITENVHVKQVDEDKVEVAMVGVKTAKETKEAKCDCGCGGDPEKCDCPEDCECKQEQEQEKEASPKKETKTAEELKKRAEARKRIVEAQPFGGQGGGMGAPGFEAGGPGAAGGTTLPAAPPGAEMGAEPGVEALSEDTESADSLDETPESLPPGSICPSCGSDDVNIKGGDMSCNNCGAEGTIEVNLRMKGWPDTIQEKGPEGEGGELEEGLEEGIGEMEGGEGIEMPEVGLAATYRITPEMVKTAGNKPVGSYCPHCGSGEVKISSSKHSGACKSCGGRYRIDTYVDTESKELIGRIAWVDRMVKKYAEKKAEKAKQQKFAARSRSKKTASRLDSLATALKAKGWTKKFARADINAQADMVAQLAEQGLIPKA